MAMELDVRHYKVFQELAGLIEYYGGQAHVGVAKIGKRAKIDRTTVAELVKDLEGGGLPGVRRHESGSGFANTYRLTPKGQEKLAEIKSISRPSAKASVEAVESISQPSAKASAKASVESVSADTVSTTEVLTACVSRTDGLASADSEQKSVSAQEPTRSEGAPALQTNKPLEPSDLAERQTFLQVKGLDAEQEASNARSGKPLTAQGVTLFNRSSPTYWQEVRDWKRGLLYERFARKVVLVWNNGGSYADIDPRPQPLTRSELRNALLKVTKEIPNIIGGTREQLMTNILQDFEVEMVYAPGTVAV